MVYLPAKETAWKMAENDSGVDGSSIGDGPTMPPGPSHGGRRLAAGKVILGRYAVESELGQGGMGVVYKCLDQVGGVRVAVKGLPPDVAHNEGEMEEIRANFQLVCDLRHENIACARTLEKDAAGDYYLVMDLAHGDDLGSWMRKNKDADVKARLSIIRQIASALDYAHRRKVMHRDIKPGNVMVSPSGRVLLLDFGLAAQISTSLSRTSHMVVSQSGTPAYKSPEQWRGRPQGAAADQYALAVVAYRLLSGRLPFDGDDMFVLCRAVLEEKPPAIKGLPSHANKALARALAKDPHDRFPTCTAFADALEGKNATGGFWKLLSVTLLLVIVLLAACGVWLYFEGKEPFVDQPQDTNTPQPPATNTVKKVIPPQPPQPPATNTVKKVVPPPPITQINADRARSKAEDEQKKARDAGVNVQNDDYQAACLRMEEAEELYKKGNYKQAVSKFALAAKQFSATYPQEKNGQTPTADGKSTVSSYKTPIDSGKTAVRAKTAADGGQTATGSVQTTNSVKTVVGIQAPQPAIVQVPQPTIEQKKADGEPHPPLFCSLLFN